MSFIDWTELRKTGLVFGKAGSLSDLLTEIKEGGEIYYHRDSNHDGVTFIRQQGQSKNSTKPGNRGFSNKGLFYHTDGSGNYKVPKYLLMLAIDYSESKGGESLFANIDDALNNLCQTDPSQVAILQDEKCAKFISGSEEYNGPLAWKNNEIWEGRMRFDEQAFYNFETMNAIPALLKSIEFVSTTRQLSDGEFYLLNNERWLHGRQPFSGRRVGARILFDEST